MNIPWLRFRGRVRGIFSLAIPYNPLLEDGDSSPYFGTYEGQKYGRFETSCCWDFSAAELAETRMEMLWKIGLINEDNKKWLRANNYIDSTGDFYFSRRWVAILSGVRDAGNDPLNFWRIASVAGLIPNAMLPYSVADASKWLNQQAFNNDYFNPQAITKEMELLGEEFAKRFKIRAETIEGGYVLNIAPLLEMYLKEGSIQISHPVPQDGTWNTFKINAPVGRLQADHATECYKFNLSDPYPVFDYDSYEPHLKQLSRNYFIPHMTRVSIVPVSTPSVAVPVTGWEKLWYNLMSWLNGIPTPYPDTLIGSA